MVSCHTWDYFWGWLAVFNWACSQTSCRIWESWVIGCLLSCKMWLFMSYSHFILLLHLVFFCWCHCHCLFHSHFLLAFSLVLDDCFYCCSCDCTGKKGIYKWSFFDSSFWKNITCYLSVNFFWGRSISRYSTGLESFSWKSRNMQTQHWGKKDFWTELFSLWVINYLLAIFVFFFWMLADTLKEDTGPSPH